MLALVLAVCDAGVFWLNRPGVGPGSTAFMSSATGQNSEISALLDRRARAVTGRNESQFMADVDQTNSTFTSHEHTEYANLTALAPTSFTYTLDEPGRYLSHSLATDLEQRYDGVVRVVGVTVKYTIGGVDTVPVAEPWIAIFGWSSGRWLLAGELRDLDDASLPMGAGGLPWEGLPITVVRGAHAVVVVSTEDKQIAQKVVNLSETAISRVDKVRPDGWAGKVLVTAVSDETLFNTYFAGSQERIQQVAAMAVPRYQAVPEWHETGLNYAASRILFNPTEIGRADSTLQHTLTHEFTHAAMGPLTTDYTPLWLVEGMAEYVAYSSESVSAYDVAQALRELSPTDLPADRTFYQSADNYVLGWLACKYAAEKYGQAKLIALYSYYHDHSGDGISAVLGVSAAQFTADWLNYLKKQRG